MSKSHRIVPIDFMGENPPGRIIGTECEYNVQLSRIMSPSDFFSMDAIAKAGYAQAKNDQCTKNFLDNGGCISLDVGHIEYSSAESLGPAQAAAADAAGILAVRKIVDASGETHRGIYRHSGTTIKGRTETNGYHENLMFPRSLADDPFIDTVIASHVTSRIWAMAGTLDEGFVLSQKVEGVTDPPVDRTGDRRRKNKPMILIPQARYDTDTVGDKQWARLEVRLADPGFSYTNEFLALASMSHALRLLEHKRMIRADMLKAFSFKKPSLAARVFSRDLTFTQTAETVERGKISALDFQEMMLEEVADLSEKVKLPEDEVMAIELWQNVCDAMRKSDIKNSDYAGLTKLLNFAPRHHILKNNISGTIDSKNDQAVAANSKWNRSVPEGPGEQYWNRQPSPYVSRKEVDYLVDNPPLHTRAFTRSNLLRNNRGVCHHARWSSMDIESGTVYMNYSYAA